MQIFEEMTVLQFIGLIILLFLFVLVILGIDGEVKAMMGMVIGYLFRDVVKRGG